MLGVDDVMTDLSTREEVKVDIYLGWTIKVIQQDEYFLAECISPEGTISFTSLQSKAGSAYRYGCRLVDKEMEKGVSNTRNSVVKSLTLVLMYLTGGYEETYDGRLTGKRTWKGYDFDVLNQFEAEKLIWSQRRKQNKSVVLTKKGIEQAEELLRSLNIPGAADLIDDLDGYEFIEPLDDE